MKTYDDCLNAAREYYAKPGNECGGSLHVVLDDGNLDSIPFCREWAEKEGDEDGVKLCDMLSDLEELELRKLYCKLHSIPYYDPYLDDDEDEE